nr:Bifunctional metallophosphatase/5'-nucleotidase [Pandoravirus belohorizontensis]
MARGERVVILAFNDIYVLEQPAGSANGGFVGLCAMIARERRAALDDPDDPAGAVIVCCCGDFMTAAAGLSGRGPQDCGRHMVPLLAEAGVTHVVPGNHEFDRGTHGCALRSAESPFCWLCTNIDAARPENPPPSVAPGPLARPASVWSGTLRDVAAAALDHVDGRDMPFGAGVRADAVATRGGHRIALVGFCTPHAPAISSAGDGGASFVAPDEALDAVSPVLADADAVVALTHMDLDEDIQFACHARDRVDVVLGGHEHHVIVDRADGRASIVKCGSDADHLGRIVLRVGPGCAAGARVESIDILPNAAAAPATPDEQSTRARVGALLGRLAAQRPKADTDPNDLTLADTAALCVFSRATSSTAARSGPCPLADLFCDLLAEADGGDRTLVLLQGGGLRGARDYAASHVFTAGDLRAEMPTMSRCTVRLVAGDRLAAAFEHAVAGMSAGARSGDADNAPEGAITRDATYRPTHSRALLHVSAPWRVVYDAQRPAGCRVVSITCDGVPLATDALYRVVMQQFVARGGDGFHMLVGAPPTPSPIEAVFMRRVVADRLLDAAARDPHGVLPMGEPHVPRVFATRDPFPVSLP